MSNSANENNGHPAWQEVLNEIPEEYHALIKPKLAEWDKGVQDRFQQIRDEYKPLEGYKKFADNNIDPDYLVNSYNLAKNFETRPQDIVEEAIKVYGLDFAAKTEEEPGDSYSDNEFESTGQLDPSVKALMDQMQELREQIQQRSQQDEEAENIKEFVAYLDQLEENHGEFDKDYVTALISQGVDGEEAVSRYKAMSTKQLEQQVLSTEQQNTPNPPTVMNGEGNSGSGLEQQPIDFGKASSGDIDDVVAKMLAASQQNNQG